MAAPTAYGAVDEGPGHEALTSTQGGKPERHPLPPQSGPVFFENPDGTITEAVPSNDEKKKKQKLKAGSRSDRGQVRRGAEGDSDGSSNSGVSATATMFQEVDFLYVRHERLFALLICTQGMLDVLYVAVYLLRMDQSVVELCAMYNWPLLHDKHEGVARAVLWTVFCFIVGYAATYYSLALLALWTRLPRHYRMLANWGLVGIIGLALLAYVDKFNLPIFFLRLLGYIYARFLQGLAVSLLLLPPGGVQPTIP